MKDYLLRLFYLILILVIVGCAEDYVPSKANTPLLSKANEFQAKATVGVSGADLQAAYSPIKYFGLMLNGNLSARGGTFKTENHKHQYIEAGIGYYYPFNVKYRFEIFGVYGIGVIESYNFTSHYISGFSDINKIFIQPAIGMVNPGFEIGFSGRFGVLNITNSSPDITGPGNYYPVIEPALTVKMGIQIIKPVIQMGYSFVLINKDNAFFTRKSFYITAGIHFKIPQNYK